MAAATSEPAHPAAVWSHRTIAEEVTRTAFASISASQVGRILAGLDRKAHRVHWLTRRDTPGFWDRVADVCGLYRDPPPGSVVLSIGEKTAIAARSRRHPGSPARAGEPARQEFEYRRHDTASLVAALNVRTGEVLTETTTRNDAATFTGFLDQLDVSIAAGQDVHAALACASTSGAPGLNHSTGPPGTPIQQKPAAPGRLRAARGRGALNARRQEKGASGLQV
ncbi:transposase [Streptomyces boluensis]|uniref:Transposase n=1 Tax=Streptomyces boluensis TaxID=1775135 RepID=A0A964ULL4_9ACTN|nr:transposase [Streptomyces boluensis]NBE51311.1 hypothetical protein [Streptomyces boluensis]